MYGGLYHHLDEDVSRGINKAVVPDPEPFGVARGSGDVPPCSYPVFILDRSQTFKAVVNEQSHLKGETTCRGDATFMSNAPAMVAHPDYPQQGKKVPHGGAAVAVSEGPLSLGHTVECNGIEILRRRVDVWNGVSEFPARPRWTGSPLGSSKEKRGKITKRSRKSRVRQLKHFLKLPSLPEMFSTLTFSDDVVGGMSQAEQIDFGNRCKRALSSWLWKCMPSEQFEFTWSQEWKHRKSGNHKGKLVLHLHVLWQIPGKSQAEYHQVALNMSMQWVRITGTHEPERAMKVLLRPESHQFIGGSAKCSIGYATKYSVKEWSDPGEQGESIGRCWGSWGPMEEAEPDTIAISESELTAIKRGLRRKFRKAKGGFLMSMKVREAGTMAIMSGSEVIRWVETMRIQNKGPDLPF